MKFCLHYYGRLRSHDDAKGKHLIRSELHRQIKNLCATEPFYHAFRPPPGDMPMGERVPIMYRVFGPKKFWFLIAEQMKTVVDLKITLLVPHRVGSIVVNGGDVDNRLKTLFDALRSPQAESEIPIADGFSQYEDGMFCLLEDDKLIGGLAVALYQDHDITDPDFCRCLIEVQTRITAATWSNMHFV